MFTQHLSIAAYLLSHIMLTTDQRIVLALLLVLQHYGAEAYVFIF